MDIDKTTKFEKATVQILNLDGWNLKHIGGMSRYDAKGFTPKGHPAVLEMKFRTKYYEGKMIEKKKYDALMSMPGDIVKLYFVADPKGNYLFWLNDMSMPTLETVRASKTTYWGGDKETKEVYYLNESKASIVTYNEVDPQPSPWAEYFSKENESKKK
tara:strand:- start:419 stop:892 length:474 start_codon:yes stop_codon:yes gene_type:complete